MLKTLLRRYGIIMSTLLLSCACIITSVLITVILGVIIQPPDFRFTLAVAVVCPSIIAPVVIFSYSKLSEELDKSRTSLKKLNSELQSALDEIRKLNGLLPICASCKKIRDDKGYWSQIESYIMEHANVQFSHGICPDCAEKLYPDIPLYESDEKD